MQSPDAINPQVRPLHRALTCDKSAHHPLKRSLLINLSIPSF